MKEYLKAISKRKLNLKLIALVIFCMSNFLATTNLCFADDRQNAYNDNAFSRGVRRQ